MKKNLVTALLLLAGLNGSMAYAGKTFAEKLEEKYFTALDEWVSRGGKVNEFQNIVIETCGKLVMAAAGTSEALALTTMQREEFDFRVGVCAKTTVNRTHHQTEFDDPKTVQAICDDNKVLLFRKLCERSGLR